MTSRSKRRADDVGDGLRGQNVRLENVSDAHTVLRKPTDADLDRFEAMCAGLFSLLPEDNERTTILEEKSANIAVEYA